MPRASSQDNWLLARLGRQERDRLESQMSWVELSRGSCLYRCGGLERHAYFPTTAAISIRCALSDGSLAEVGSVGREGMLGVGSLIGGGCSSKEAEVSVGGLARKISCSALQEEFHRAGQFHYLALAYAQARATASAQLVACNRFHTVGQQLSRWILCSLDRIDGMEFHATHESVAEALGVRRESISTAACELRRRGALSYSRGMVKILDRSLIERKSCECYKTLKGSLGAWRDDG